MGALCASCGLCCDGSIYDNVGLSSEETEFAAALGLNVQNLPHGSCFDQPCPHSGPSGCAIHHLPRPRVCGDFNCGVITRIESGAQSLEEAAAHIATAKSLIALVRTRFLPGETMGDARMRWAAQTGDRAGPADPILSLAMAALTRHLDRHFRFGNQAMIRPAGKG